MLCQTCWGWFLCGDWDTSLRGNVGLYVHRLLCWRLGVAIGIVVRVHDALTAQSLQRIIRVLDLSLRGGSRVVLSR